MINKKILLPLFIVIAFIQLYVPAKMILNQEEVLETGKLFKFKTAPIDPNDPFRGKYITLNFEATSIPVEVDSIWKYKQQVFITLEEDSAGFAYPKSVFQQAPDNEPHYLKVEVDGTYNNELWITYPFYRFYMDEYKAPQAETTYRQAQRDTTTIAYALVAVKSGEAALKDVFIDDVSISEVVEKARKEN
ncbi:MAG: GDYXXLXY domain-containing protein [Bacteroidota bacterium]